MQLRGGFRHGSFAARRARGSGDWAWGGRGLSAAGARDAHIERFGPRDLGRRVPDPRPRRGSGPPSRTFLQRSGRAVRQALRRYRAKSPNERRTRLRPEKFRAHSGRHRGTQQARTGNLARQPRHPAHLRGDPRGCHVRLRLGGRTGSRAAAEARPRARLRGGVEHSRRQPVRTAAHRPLVQAERAGDQLRRRTEEILLERAPKANRRSKTSKNGRKASTATSRRYPKPSACHRQPRRRDRGLCVHRLDLRQRRRQGNRQLELLGEAAGKVRRHRRLEDLPRP